MKKKSLFGALVSAALVASFALVPSAQAASKTIVVWADDQRGPDLKKFLEGNTTIAPGYVIKISTYSNYDALDAAWQKASAASGPDIMFNPVGDALKYARSGKVLPLFLPVEARRNISDTALRYATYQGKIYAVPLDIDTTSMYWNTKFGPAPETFADLAAAFTKAKAAGTATVGWCAGDGTWGALPFLTAMGGGAWGYVGKSSTPDVSKVLFNSSAAAANIKKYALGADGKTNGLFDWSGWDGCGKEWLAGKALAINTGSWRLDATKAAKISYTIQPTPTISGKGVTRQWAGFGGAWVSSFADDHKTTLGARKVLNYLATAPGSLAYATATGRPSPNNAITSKLGADAQGFAKAGALNGAVQENALLGDSTGGANWYDVLDSTFKAIFTKGEDVQATLDKGAAILKKNWEHGMTLR